MRHRCGSGGRRPWLSGDRVVALFAAAVVLGVSTSAPAADRDPWSAPIPIPILTPGPIPGQAPDLDLNLAQTGEGEALPERRRDVRRPGREPAVPEPAPAAPAAPRPGTAAMPSPPAGTPPAAATVSAGEPVSSDARGSLPPVSLGELGAFPALPDRWRIVDAAPLSYPRRLVDPYNTANILKGDRPFRDDWFFQLGIVSDTVIEPRNVPTPVGVATTDSAGSLDLFGDGDQLFIAQTIAMEFVVYKGDTVFRPPDYEFRFIPAFNYNRLETGERGVVRIDPTKGTDRTETFAGIQTLFVDVHLRNVSDRYDFDSVRFGIQPISADFRGFLFLDQPFGARLFGTRANNRFQYNLAWFKRLDKDVNSGLNDVGEGLRKDDVLLANLYWQDFPRLGFFSQATLLHNRNREGNEFRYDENGFLSRPSSLFEERGREYDVTYLGYNGDGHLGRINLSTSFYYAFGEESVAGAGDIDISAFFGAAEASLDFDWIRLRLSGVYGSGDSDPFDDKATGFDAVFENPQIAGADTSYWIRQGIPLIGGGGVALSQRNGVLTSLRPTKEQGQSNFTNPGILLLGIGADFDLLPMLRLSANLNQLWFNKTDVLEAARQQAGIDKDIGTDVSLSLIYRPLLSQNIVLRLSGAMLLPGKGYKQLYDDQTPYSILANMVLTY